MDFDSILRFFRVTKEGETSCQEQDVASPILKDDFFVNDLNPTDIYEFAESFKILNVLDETNVQTPINANKIIDKSFLYHNDDLTVIDLENAHDIRWNDFMKDDVDSTTLQPANCEKKTATVDLDTIINHEGDLIFAGDEFDTINFADEGWELIEHISGDQDHPNYDVFLHVETGAVVQIENSIITHYPEG
ncbi:MAG: hypothetical protein ABFQ95_08465 [Pseudomonadota bacterium]